MPALLIFLRADKSQRLSPLIVPFDPSIETQIDVERKHGVSSSQYFDTLNDAKQELERINLDSL